jgi:hypothetical protein
VLALANDRTHAGWMANEAAAGGAGRFEVGDRVIARVNIGGIFRPRVRRDTRGVVAGRTPAGELEVHFDGGGLELVDPERLTPA